MLIALQGAVSQGVLWGIMVLGVFITFRLLDIPDMTCDGSFALGANRGLPGSDLHQGQLRGERFQVAAFILDPGQDARGVVPGYFGADQQKAHAEQKYQLQPDAESERETPDDRADDQDHRSHREKHHGKPPKPHSGIAGTHFGRLTNIEDAGIPQGEDAHGGNEVQGKEVRRLHVLQKEKESGDDETLAEYQHQIK